MAQEYIFSLVESHREVAVLAIFDGFAGGALDEGMKAPAVEKKHNLPVLATGAFHAFLEIFADHSAKAGRGWRGWADRELVLRG